MSDRRDHKPCHRLRSRADIGVNHRLDPERRAQLLPEGTRTGPHVVRRPRETSYEPSDLQGSTTERQYVIDRERSSSEHPTGRVLRFAPIGPTVTAMSEFDAREKWQES